MERKNGRPSAGQDHFCRPFLWRKHDYTACQIHLLRTPQCRSTIFLHAPLHTLLSLPSHLPNNHRLSRNPPRPLVSPPPRRINPLALEPPIPLLHLFLSPRRLLPPLHRIPSFLQLDHPSLRYQTSPVPRPVFKSTIRLQGKGNQGAEFLLCEKCSASQSI